MHIKHVQGEIFELIDNFEKDIYKRIEELKKLKLVQGTTHLSIRSENAAISSQLDSGLDRPALDAMSVISIIIPQDKYSQGIFSPRDEPFVSLYNSLGYIQQGIYIKISFGGKIYSCMLEVKSDLSELHDKVARLKYFLGRIGIYILALEKVPLKPISLFPFFVIASDIIKKINIEWANKQFKFTQDEAKLYIENWFKDYLRAKLKISQNVKNYSIVDPNYEKPKEIIAFVNTKFTELATFHYISDLEDKITLQLVETVPSLKHIPKGEQYPSVDKLTTRRAQFAINLFSTLGNPKAVAIHDIGHEIEEFNRKSKVDIFDTSIITKDSFTMWIKMHINAKRQLIEYFQSDDMEWNNWKKPIRVYANYKLHEKQPNIRQSGYYSIYYENSDQDEIFVHELIDEQTDNDMFSVTNKQKCFFSSHGDLLAYLREIKGEYFHSYF